MKQWRDDIKRFFATYFMINYETGMLEWIDGGEVKTRDDAYGNPMIRYGTRDYYVNMSSGFCIMKFRQLKKLSSGMVIKEIATQTIYYWRFNAMY